MQLYDWDPSVPQLRGWALPVRQSLKSQQKISAFSCHRSARFTIPTSIHTVGSGLFSLLPSIPPSIHPPPPPHPLACFLSLSRKGDPLYSSEIKTGRCKLQINMIKCLRYHEPSHWSGCLAGLLAGSTPSSPHPPRQHGLGAPSLCLSVEADRWRSWGDVQSFCTSDLLSLSKTTLSGYH